MIKSELIKRISSKNPHLFERDMEKVVNAILNEMIEALRRGDRVELRGFGAFSAKLREATSRGSRSTWSAYANANLPMASSNSSLEARDTPLMVAGFSVTFRVCAGERPATGPSMETPFDSDQTSVRCFCSIFNRRSYAESRIS